MTEAAKNAKREYARKYREQNRLHLNEYHRKWRKENPEKIKQYNETYWEKKAAEAIQ